MGHRVSGLMQSTHRSKLPSGLLRSVIPGINAQDKVLHALFSSMLRLQRKGKNVRFVAAIKQREIQDTRPIQSNPIRTIERFQALLNDIGCHLPLTSLTGPVDARIISCVGSRCSSVSPADATFSSSRRANRQRTATCPIS